MTHTIVFGKVDWKSIALVASALLFIYLTSLNLWKFDPIKINSSRGNRRMKNGKNSCFSATFKKFIKKIIVHGNSYCYL